MDELLEQFGSLGDEAAAGNSRTSFDGLYKNRGRLDHQEIRRKIILEKQKCDRSNNFDKTRGILDLVADVESATSAAEEDADYVQRVHYRPTVYVAGFHKVAFNKVLMMSEWMVEKPHDFEENWLVVPCPTGVRILLISQRGITKAYTKYGQFMFQARSALPGGNPGGRNKSQCCVLDGFYDATSKTMYVLDLLAWKSQPMTDGEAEFRHYWLKSQFYEKPELGEMNESNQIIFKILPKLPCDKDTFNDMMMKYPQFGENYPKLDGLLFYHKRAHYFGGETPLVGWLFPFMVPEVIGEDVTVNRLYMLDKPIDYENQREYIKLFYQRQQNKRIKKKSGPSPHHRMDLSAPSTSVQKITEDSNMEAELLLSECDKSRMFDLNNLI